MTHGWLVAGAFVAACSTAPPPPELVSDPATLELGRTLFLAHCALCHGVRGDGHGPRREGLNPPPADFTNSVWRRDADPRRLHDVIRDGKAGTPMPAWRALDDREIWALVAYVLAIGGNRP